MKKFMRYAEGMVKIFREHNYVEGSLELEASVIFDTLRRIDSRLVDEADVERYVSDERFRHELRACFLCFADEDKDKALVLSISRLRDRIKKEGDPESIYKLFRIANSVRE